MIGRVCMQMTLVDVTGIPDVAPGDEALLLGGAEGADVPAGELARLAGTIPYELCCALGRNPRRVVGA